MPRWHDPTPPPEAKTLAPAAKAMRRRAREKRQAARYDKAARAAEAGVDLPVAPRQTSEDFLSKMHESATLRDKKIAAVHAAVERVIGQSTTRRLDQLLAALSLFERQAK